MHFPATNRSAWCTYAEFKTINIARKLPLTGVRQGTLPKPLENKKKSISKQEREKIEKYVTLH